MPCQIGVKYFLALYSGKSVQSESSIVKIIKIGKVESMEKFKSKLKTSMDRFLAERATGGSGVFEKYSLQTHLSFGQDAERDDPTSRQRPECRMPRSNTERESDNYRKLSIF